LAHGLAGGRIAVEEPRARVDPGVDEERAGVFDKEDRLPGHLRSQILKAETPKKINVSAGNVFEVIRN